MTIKFHPHALARMAIRGATQQEVIETIEMGERFDAKYGRMGFRRNFVYDKEWQSQVYGTKQIEAYVVDESGWLVITVIVKYF